MMKHGWIFLFVFVLAFPAKLPAPQTPDSPPAPVRWVPFRAKQIEVTLMKTPFREEVVPLRCKGIYAQSSTGDTYSSLDCPKTATIINRQKHIRWELDLAHNEARSYDLDAGGQSTASGQSITPEAFSQGHSADKPLGRKVISRIDCEGYLVQAVILEGKPHTEKVNAEVWFAPALNFARLKQHFVFDGNDTTITLNHIELGKEPDPSLFQIPAKFKIQR